MTAIRVTLPEETAERLRELARRELRDPRAQAAWLINEGLKACADGGTSMSRPDLDALRAKIEKAKARGRMTVVLSLADAALAIAALASPATGDSRPESFRVTDPDADAPDGTRMMFERVRGSWEPVGDSRQSEGLDWLAAHPDFACYCGSPDPGTDGVCRACNGACYHPRPARGSNFDPEDQRHGDSRQREGLRAEVERLAWVIHRNHLDGGTHADTDWRVCGRYNCRRAALAAAAPSQEEPTDA